MIDYTKVKSRAVAKCEDDTSYFNRFVSPRLRQDETYYNEKVEHLKKCSQKELADVRKFWEEFIPNQLGVVNYDMFDVYNAYCEDKDMLKYYVPDSFFYAFIDEYYTNPQRSIPWDDKNMYDTLFHDIHRPDTLFRKVGDMYFDKNGNVINAGDVLQMCIVAGEVVMKAATRSYGGHGVRFWSYDKNGTSELVDLLNNKHAFYPSASARPRFEIVGQRAMKQHEVLSGICKTSVNTVRVMTWCNGNETVALSSILRMGINGSRVDNASSGGIFCGINNGGTLKDVAYDTTGKCYKKHPDGTLFAGKKLPNYDKLIDLAISLQNRFTTVSRMISWDFAIDEDGNPTLIEMNISFGEIDFHQMCNGPIFGNKLPIVLDELLAHSYTLRRLL